jgi:hypothetical protein
MYQHQKIILGAATLSGTTASMPIGVDGQIEVDGGRL